MTLNEYLIQENPTRMPEVWLEEGEYIPYLSVKAGDLILTTVEIPALRDRFSDISPVYVQIDDYETLYTQDENGNPDRRSCFHIKKYAK